MSSRVAVERWINKAILHVPEDGSTLDRIVLRHASGGSRAPEVEAIKIADPTEASAAKLAGRVWEAAEQDAEGLGGLVQRYVAHAYYGQGKEPECGRCVFAVHREEEAGSSALDSEPADHRGLVSQALRHNEAAMRIALGASQSIFTQMTRMLETMGAQNERLQEKLQEARESGDEASFEREEAKRRAEKEDRREKVLYESLQTIAPIVLAKLAAAQTGGVVPQLPSAAKDLVVDRLLGSVTAEQLAALQTILKPEQMALFIAAYETRILDKEAPAQPGAPLAKVNGHGGQALWKRNKWCLIGRRD